MRKRLPLLALFAAVYLAYFPLNRILENAQTFKTPLDDSIPLIAAFSVPYLTFLPLIAGLAVLFFLKAPDRLFKSLMVSGILATLASYLIFTLFPTSIERPDILGSDIFSDLVRFIYSHDRPYNLFPSGHTFNTVIFALHLIKWKPKLALLTGAVSFLIILSTLLIKQHYLPDVVGGIILGGGTALLSLNFKR